MDGAGSGNATADTMSTVPKSVLRERVRDDVLEQERVHSSRSRDFSDSESRWRPKSRRSLTM